MLNKRKRKDFNFFLIYKANKSSLKQTREVKKYELNISLLNQIGYKINFRSNSENQVQII